MNPETKQCQNCKSSFVIEPEHFAFYERIAVPPPTFCSECRLIRRLIWRNERSLHSRECDLCHKKILAVYPKDSRFTVYCPECWRGDDWDPMTQGTEYDFTKPFFEQYKQLMTAVPRMALNQNGTNMNCGYANYIEGAKNAYYSFSTIWGSEDVYYSQSITNSKDITDCTNVSESETLYQSIGGVKNYQCKFTYWSSNCIDCTFSIDLANCSNCVGCVGLKNKQYCIFNEQYSKDEYTEKLASCNLHTYYGQEEFKQLFHEFADRFPRRYAMVLNCYDSTGDDLLNSKGMKDCFASADGENITFGLRVVGGCKDCMDVGYMGPNELTYEHGNGGSSQSQNLKFIAYGRQTQINVTYGDYCNASSDMFGCIAVKNKQYCILNKEYTKEEYETLVPKIIAHMSEMPYTDAHGRVYTYGEHFPYEFSPFAYNETLAQEYFPLSKDEAIVKGYKWRDPEPRTYQPTKKPEDLPDSINDVAESITNEIIGCAHAGTCNHQCATAFKIIPVELAQYKKIGVPLPRLCPNCRHYERLAKRNPLRLWPRQCNCGGPTSANGLYQNTASHLHHTDGPCKNVFETPYSPDRSEIVYCEQCYQQEVV